MLFHSTLGLRIDGKDKIIYGIISLIYFKRYNRLLQYFYETQIQQGKIASELQRLQHTENLVISF